MSNSWTPHGVQHDRFPCPSPSPEICSSLCPLSLWCYPTISSPVNPFSHLQSFPASGSFPRRVGSSPQLAKGLELQHSMNVQDWSPLGWTSWISLQSKGLSRVFSSTTVQKHQFFSAQCFFMVTINVVRSGCSFLWLHTAKFKLNSDQDALYFRWRVLFGQTEPSTTDPTLLNLNSRMPILQGKS